MKKFLILVLILVFSLSFTVLAEQDYENDGEEMYQEEQMEDAQTVDVEETQEEENPAWDISNQMTLIQSIEKAVEASTEKYPKAVPFVAKLSDYKGKPQYEVHLKVNADQYIKAYVSLNGKVYVADRKGKLYDLNYKKKSYKKKSYNNYNKNYKKKY